MSDNSRAIVPVVGQRAVVASVSRQLAATEKVLARILAGGALSNELFKPDLVVQGNRFSFSIAAISDNGRFVLTVENNMNGIFLWVADNFADVSLLKVFGQNLPKIIKINFLPDSNNLAVTNHADFSLRFWDLTTSTCYCQLLGHQALISAYDILPSGFDVISGDEDGIVKIWDTRNGECLLSQKMHTDRICFVKFRQEITQERIMAFSGSDDGTIKIFKTSNGECLHVIHDEFIFEHYHPTAFSPSENNELIIFGLAEDAVRHIYNIENGQLLGKYETCFENVDDMVVSSDFRYILYKTINDDDKLDTDSDSDSISDDNQIHACFLYDCITGNAQQLDYDYQDWFLLDLSDYGRYALLRYAGDAECILCNLENDGLIHGTFRHSSVPNYDHAACSDDGNHVVATGGGHLHHWDLQKGQLACSVPCADQVDAIAFSKENHLAIAQDNSQAYLFSWQDMHPKSSWPDFQGDIPFQLCDIVTGKCIQVFEGHTGKINTIAFSSDGKSVGADCFNGNTNAWNIETGDLFHTMKIHQPCASVFTSSTVGWLWGSDCSLSLRLRDTGIQKNLLLPDIITSVALSHDNRHLATGCADGFVGVWCVDGDFLISLNGHEAAIKSLKFSPNGDLVSASEDCSIRLWGFETGDCLRIFTGHSNSVIHASFSNDGQQIISASKDGTIRFWDVKTGAELAKCYGFDDGNWAVVAPDGRYDSLNDGDCSYLRWTVGMESYPVTKYKEHYYTPGLLVQVRDVKDGV